MNAWKPLIVVSFTLGLLAALPSTSEGAKASASACLKPSGGTWAFGQAPTGCAPLSDAATLEQRYPGLVFNERASQERRRYTNALHAYLRDGADYYLTQRRRQIDPAERAGWRKAVMALAHQESFWSHYRESKKDGALKVMRGDRNFAHGLLQIDERWHPKMTMNARGEDLSAHLMYGLDVFFQGWEKAAKAPCVRKGNSEDRARAAYASFNGGATKLCRWTNAKDRWAKNDAGFMAKWKNQSWQYALAGEVKPSPVDIACLVEGKRGCANVIEFKVTKLIYRLQARVPKGPAFENAASLAALGRGQRKLKVS
ncbi:MAG: hypothetical protein EOP11_07980 [Proteobacteria bacterium]|nr:MAG: hypothetical protein EOP11_07980 [Pseudomonadota bacterium]